MEAASNNGLSVSHVFNRPNLRSLSLASVSEVTKAQIANYFTTYLANNGGVGGNGTTQPQSSNTLAGQQQLGSTGWLSWEIT